MTTTPIKDYLGRVSRLAAASVFALTAASLAAQAEEYVLSSWLPPSHPLVTGAIQPWADQVAEVTDGRVTVRILPRPLGPPPAHFDMAADGIADITYGLHSFTTDDRFLRSRIGQFSFLGDDAASTSVAYWNVYGGQLDAAAEHEGTKVLGLWVHGPGMLHNSKKKIEEPGDFAGMKIRVPGGYVAELSEKLGVTTQFMGPGEVFEKLSTGVIDGATFPAEALKAFNLSPHIKYSMTVPGGLYNTSWFLVMNGDRWAGISAEDQAAIEAISGAALAETVGKVWNAADAGGVEDAKAHGVEFHEASEPVLARVQEIASAKEAEWAEAVSAQGHDGIAALAALREQAE
ncbi:MAG: TRAP transporter substrate-binding protein [Paracoccus sp. (in: a-proteobacteria)]